jgi:hypothetical protein
MSNSTPTDLTTRALRAVAISHLYENGYAVERAPASQFALQQQVYIVSKAGQTRIVALRTSKTGWIGFRRDGNTFPVLSGIDSVLHVYLHQNRQFFAVTLLPAVDVRSALDLRVTEAVAMDREPSPIVWINAVELADVCLQDYFVLAGVHPIPESFVGASNEPDDADPIQAALGLPDWMWQEIQDRANRAVVSPEVIIRVLLGDHLAAATQAPLPVALGA